MAWEDVLAGGLAGTEGGGLDGGRGLVVLVGLLDQKCDTTLFSGNDADSLIKHNQYCLFQHCASVVRGRRTLLAMEPSF